MASASQSAKCTKPAIAWMLMAGFLCAIMTSQETPNTYTFKSETELVLVNVTVRDRNGNPVRNLKREDFTLLEDNKPQQVISFDLENTDVVLPTAVSEAPLLGKVLSKRSPNGPSGANQSAMAT